MITVTRLNDQPLVLNAELIKTVESTPDTLITLINGDRMMVKESMEEIVRKAVEYGLNGEWLMVNCERFARRIIHNYQLAIDHSPLKSSLLPRPLSISTGHTRSGKTR